MVKSLLAGEKIIGSIDRLEPNMYPFAIFYDYPQRQDFWAKSTCELILDNQKLINKVESIIAMIGTLLQNPQRVVSKRSGINPQEVKRFANAPGHVWVSNDLPDRSMYWQQPPQIPPSLINLAEMAKANIREITGLTEAYMGESVGSLQTSQGVNQLIDRATMRDRDQMYDVELFVEQLTRLVVAFIATKYVDERWMRVLADPSNPQAGYEFRSFIGREFENIEFDFDIDVSGKAPITRMRRQQEAERLLNLQGQYQFTPAVITPQEFLKFSDMADKDKLLQRMNNEELQSNLDILTQVANMMNEALSNGIPNDEVLNMAYAQLQQLESGQNKALGSTNSSDVQMRQGGI